MESESVSWKKEKTSERGDGVLVKGGGKGGEDKGELGRVCIFGMRHSISEIKTVLAISPFLVM